MHTREFHSDLLITYGEEENIFWRVQGFSSAWR